MERQREIDGNKMNLYGFRVSGGRCNESRAVDGIDRGGDDWA